MGGIDGLWGGARAPCSLWASCQLLPNSFHHCDQCEYISRFENGFKIHKTNCDQCENISRFENGLKIHNSPLMLGLVQSGIVIFYLWTRKSIIFNLLVCLWLPARYKYHPSISPGTVDCKSQLLNNKIYNDWATMLITLWAFRHNTEGGGHWTIGHWKS